MGVGDCYGHQSPTDDAEGVALDESSRAPVAFQISANKPQREHIEKDVAETDVQQRVRHQLPHLAVLDHGRRNEHQLHQTLADKVGDESEGYDLKEIYSRASEDDAL